MHLFHNTRTFHSPGQRSALASQDAENRCADRSSLECSAGALEIAHAALKVQLKGMTDDDGIALIEDIMMQIDQAAGAMRFRAGEI